MCWSHSLRYLVLVNYILKIHASTIMLNEVFWWEARCDQVIIIMQQQVQLIQWPARTPGALWSNLFSYLLFLIFLVYTWHCHNITLLWISIAQHLQSNSSSTWIVNKSHCLLLQLVLLHQISKHRKPSLILFGKTVLLYLWLFWTLDFDKYWDGCSNPFGAVAESLKDLSSVKIGCN